MFFELEVLERYYADPRYYFSFEDYNGYISITSSFDQSEDIAEKDKVFLQTFGLGYDSNKNRVVVVYLRYLSYLTPEHQQIWNAQKMDGDCRIAEAYWRNTVGEWAEGGSIYDAFLEEQKAINEMSKLMGRRWLFRKTFLDEKRPKEFGIFLRPTRKSYLAFAHLLDKMLSENIDTAFVEGEVPLQETIKRREGTVEQRNRGSLAVLDDWLKKTFRPVDSALFNDVMEPMREVRKLRRTPAHVIEEDEYDRKYHREQDELIARVYSALRTLRMMFALHPLARQHSMPDWIEKGEIFIY